jgi:hypothetical protein
MRRYVIVRDDGFIDSYIDDGDTRIGKLKRLVPFLRKPTLDNQGFVRIDGERYHWDPKKANPVYIRLGRSLWANAYLGMQMVWNQHVPAPRDLSKDNDTFADQGRTSKAIDDIVEGAPIDGWLGRKTDYALIALAGVVGLFAGTMIGSFL